MRDRRTGRGPLLRYPKGSCSGPCCSHCHPGPSAVIWNLGQKEIEGEAKDSTWSLYTIIRSFNSVALPLIKRQFTLCNLVPFDI